MVFRIIECILIGRPRRGLYTIGLTWKEATALTIDEMKIQYGENMTVAEVAIFFKCLKRDGSPAVSTVWKWNADEGHPVKGFYVARNKLLFLTSHVHDVWMRMRRGEIDPFS